MNIIRLEINNIPNNISQQIKQVFTNGGVIMFPSDTVYGLAANPKNNESIKKLYKIKQRDIEKRISCIYSDIYEVEQYCDLSTFQKDIINKYTPGPFTFIVKNTKKLITPDTETLGIRIPDSKYTYWLSKILKSPYTSTSANIPGQSDNYSAEDFVNQLKDSEDKPDLILDFGHLPPTLPSTVVDLTTSTPTILRQGSGKFNIN